MATPSPEMQRAVAEAIARVGLVEKSDRAAELVADLETAIGLIGANGHYFHPQPCDICQRVSLLIRQKFGCEAHRTPAVALPTAEDIRGAQFVIVGRPDPAAPVPTRSPTDGHAPEG